MHGNCCSIGTSWCGLRTQVKSQLQALALNQGVRRKAKLGSTLGRAQLESLALLPWASRQRRGHISKQGKEFLRGLLVEAAQSAMRS
jgi:hypothetical protein